MSLPTLTISPKPLGQLLLGRGLIEPAQLDRALAEQRRGRHRKLLGEILIDLHDCTERQIAEALAEAYGVPFAALHSRLADPDALGVLPIDFIEKQQVLPLFVVDGVLTVAVAEPANIFLIEEIERLSGLSVQVVAAAAPDIRATLRASLRGENAFTFESFIDDVAPPALRLPAPEEGRPADSAPSDKLLRFCLYSAVKEGASAVHFEPMPRELRIRFRIDGQLVGKMHPPLRLLEPLLHRTKAAAGLDPSQGRLPQHGQFEMSVDGKAWRVQVSTAPSRHGETLVLRLQETDKAPASLERLGFCYDMLKQWRRLLARPEGLLLVTGPADSGRSTTLYSSLEVRNDSNCNVCSIEDPIHRSIAGVNQFQLDPSTGFDAEAALEAVLRLAPDVVLISDLPDGPTARMAARAALDGRLVLAGLSAADASQSLTRLGGLGVEPHLIAGSVAAVLCQRLVRKLCTGCREIYEPSGAERRRIDRYLPGVTTLYRPKGCDRCRQSGYAGRVGVFELLIPDDAMIDAINRGAPLTELRLLAIGAGQMMLQADGLEKVRSGITTLDEIERVVSSI